MNDQEILDNAPEGATHVEVLTDYEKIYYYRRSYKDFCNKFMYDVYQQGTWYICSDISGEFRSLADIAKIAELKSIIRGRDELIDNAVSNRIAELEKEVKGLKLQGVKKPYDPIWDGRGR
tara:strand:- start:120 stop:479 length:360 start_codon:yes stop_codon:yes gene_type:complete